MKKKDELRLMTEAHLRNNLGCLVGMNSAKVQPQIDLINEMLLAGDFAEDALPETIDPPLSKRTAPPPNESVLFEVRVAEKFSSKVRDAARRGLEFSLTLSELRRLMSRKTCAYTGLHFTSSGRKAQTLERVDSSKGYIKGNVVSVCDFANALKNSLIESKGDRFFMEPTQLRKFIKTALKAYQC